jgi:hypothetical protein
MHSQGFVGFIRLWMQIFEVYTGRARGFDLLEGTVHVRLGGPGGDSFQNMHSQCFEELSFYGCKYLRNIPEGFRTCSAHNLD